MNKIVRHYPVASLPDDVRYKLGLAATVTLTAEPNPPPSANDFQQRRNRLLKAIEQSRRSVKGHGVTAEEAVARVRALRGEWDH